MAAADRRGQRLSSWRSYGGGRRRPVGGGAGYLNRTPFGPAIRPSRQDISLIRLWAALLPLDPRLADGDRRTAAHLLDRHLQFPALLLGPDFERLSELLDRRIRLHFAVLLVLILA